MEKQLDEKKHTKRTLPEINGEDAVGAVRSMYGLKSDITAQIVAEQVAHVDPAQLKSIITEQSNKESERFQEDVQGLVATLENIQQEFEHVVDGGDHRMAYTPAERVQSFFYEFFDKNRKKGLDDEVRTRYVEQRKDTLLELLEGHAKRADQVMTIADAAYREASDMSRQSFREINDVGREYEAVHRSVDTLLERVQELDSDIAEAYHDENWEMRDVLEKRQVDMESDLQGLQDKELELATRLNTLLSRHKHAQQNKAHQHNVRNAVLSLKTSVDDARTRFTYFIQDSENKVGPKTLLELTEMATFWGTEVRKVHEAVDTYIEQMGKQGGLSLPSLQQMSLEGVQPKIAPGYDRDKAFRTYKSLLTSLRKDTIHRR